METAELGLDELGLDGLGSVELATVGKDDDRPVLFFHSPASAAEELAHAEPAALAAGVRLIALLRQSVRCDDPAQFMKVVAECIEALVAKLDAGPVPLIGWSGGAPHALCAANHLGSRVSSLGLVSPVPGPLTGPEAIPNQSDRLRTIAHSTSSSDWITGPEVLRDYQAISGPWPFDVSATTQNVSIWAPDADNVVPPHLLVDLHQRLNRSTLFEVAGTHGWLRHNWSTVLAR